VQYASGAEVSFQGYVWEAKFSASDAPASNPTGDWSAVAACSGTGASPTLTTIKSTTTMTTAGQTTTSTTTVVTVPTISAGSCAGIAAWSSLIAYTAGQQVTSGGHLWTAKWWSEADVPGGAAGDWTDNGPCMTARLRFFRD